MQGAIIAMTTLDQLFNAAAPRGRILIAPAPHERPAVIRARAHIGSVVASALTDAALAAAAKLRRRKRREADELDDGGDDDQIDQQTATDVVKAVDLSSIITPISLALGYLMLDQSDRSLSKLAG